jgi:hypothetical protein
MGLYGGLSVADIHERKGLKENEKILDFMGSTELIANLFRISQTEEKLKRDEVSSAIEANNTHYEAAEKIRKAIIEMGATLPEDLPKPEKNIQVVEREEIRRLRKSGKRLMLDVSVPCRMSAESVSYAPAVLSSNVHHLELTISWVFGGVDIFEGCSDKIADMRDWSSIRSAAPGIGSCRIYWEIRLSSITCSYVLSCNL